MKTYDIGIIGAGVAGAFAALRVAKNHPDKKVILIELGRPCGKRRRQLEGWFGCFPNSDGKLHLNDISQILDIADGRRVKSIKNWTLDIFENIIPLKIIKDRQPQVSVVKRANNLSLKIIKNDYIQWEPDEHIRKLSNYIYDTIISSNNIECSFDNEVYEINKKDNNFIINTQNEQFECNKVLVCVGRSGWRWILDLYNHFNLNVSDNVARFGIKAEIPSQYMKEFNRSHCSFIKEGLEIGPLNWGGTVVPEDHADMVISSFRANEKRWTKGTKKVIFDIIMDRPFPGSGIYETERLAKLIFLQFNDRIGREKVKTIIKNETPFYQIPECDWIKDVVNELDKLFPTLISRGYYHAPSVNTVYKLTNINKNMETDEEGLFVAGESAGIKGILGAAISGAFAIDGALK